MKWLSLSSWEKKIEDSALFFSRASIKIQLLRWVDRRLLRIPDHDQVFIFVLRSVFVFCIEMYVVRWLSRSGNSKFRLFMTSRFRFSLTWRMEKKKTILRLNSDYHYNKQEKNVITLYSKNKLGKDTERFDTAWPARHACSDNSFLRSLSI